MVAPFVAAKAYAAVQAQASSLSQSAGALGAGQVAGDAHGFGEILKSAMTEAMQSSRNAEVQMKAQVQGKADLVDVVTAITSAQTSLQTVLAVRDQVIQAYQQIMQMPI
jgi:flagellar hook-basal body complex protein FliE